MTYSLDPSIGTIITLIMVCCWLGYLLFNKPKIPVFYQDHAALMKRRIKVLEAKVLYAKHAVAHRDDVIADLRKIVTELHEKIIRIENDKS